MLEALLTTGNKKAGLTWEKQTAKYGGSLQLSSGVILRDNLYLVGGILQGTTWKSELLKFNEVTQKLDVAGNFGQIGQAPDAWVDRSNTINWISSFNTTNAFTWNPDVPGSVSNGGPISNHSYYRKAIAYTNNMDATGTNKVYFFGNDTNGNLMMYNRQNLSNTTVLTNFPLHGRHAAALLLNGKMYVFGGQISGGFTSKATMFNPETNAFTVLADMPGQRFGAAAVAIDNNTIHVIGGSDNSNVNISTTTDSILEYKISTNTWKLLATKFPMKVMYSTYVSNSKMAFIVGGYFSSTGDIYKPTLA